MTIEDFVKQNIGRINASINSFKDANANEFIDVQIKNYLQEKLSTDLQNKATELALLDELRHHNFVKAKIIEIADKFVLYKPHLEKYFQRTVFKNVFSKVGIDELADKTIDYINEVPNVDDLEVKFIKLNLKNLVSKCLYVASQGGFQLTYNIQTMGCELLMKAIQHNSFLLQGRCWQVLIALMLMCVQVVMTLLLISIPS